MLNLMRKVSGLITWLKQARQASRLAEEYRTLLREMSQVLCEQQGEINKLVGSELVQKAQENMSRTSLTYHVGLRAIINAVPKAHTKRFWKHT